METGKYKEVEPFYVVIKSDATDRTTKIAYEDIRLRTESEVTQHVVNGIIEHLLWQEKDPISIDGEERGFHADAGYGYSRCYKPPG